MIRINFAIANPFKHSPWRDLYQGSWPIGKNKVLELEFCRYAWNLVEFALDLRWQGQDHAGPKFELGLFGWHARIAIADTRHWDPTANTWIEHYADTFVTTTDGEILKTK